MVCVHEIERIVEFFNRAIVSNSVGQTMIWEGLSLRGGHGREDNEKRVCREDNDKRVQQKMTDVELLREN
jgi:hypothetical protein